MLNDSYGAYRARRIIAVSPSSARATCSISGRT